MGEGIILSTGFSLPLGLGLAALGAGLGLGKAVGDAVSAMARQPEIASTIQGAMIVGAAFIEALAIYALVVVFVLQGKVGTGG